MEINVASPFEAIEAVMFFWMGRYPTLRLQALSKPLLTVMFFWMDRYPTLQLQ
jgi:hypothetical protein